MTMMNEFADTSPFARNIGWLTRGEQCWMHDRRVAIGGLGGVGGRHLLTLIRLGVGRFNIADFDAFEHVNFNRQAGANRSTVGRQKVDVLTKMARDINPDACIDGFSDGITQDNVAAFLQNVDLYIDGLDFFAVKARRMVFAECAKRGIPAITAAPIGMGASVLTFMPGGMTFEDYFRLEGQSEEEQLVRFLVGLSPSMLQRKYLVDPTTVDLANHRGPSTVMACELCAGLVGVESLKILLGRGKVIAVPQVQQYDAYRNKLARVRVPWGNNGPLQRMKLRIARRRFGKQLAEQQERLPILPEPTPLPFGFAYESFAADIS